MNPVAVTATVSPPSMAPCTDTVGVVVIVGPKPRLACAASPPPSVNEIQQASPAACCAGVGGHG